MRYWMIVARPRPASWAQALAPFALRAATKIHYIFRILSVAKDCTGRCSNGASARGGRPPPERDQRRPLPPVRLHPVRPRRQRPEFLRQERWILLEGQVHSSAQPSSGVRALIATMAWRAVWRKQGAHATGAARLGPTEGNFPSARQFPLYFKPPYPVLLLCGGLRDGIRSVALSRRGKRMQRATAGYGAFSTTIWHLQHHHMAPSAPPYGTFSTIQSE